MLASIFLLLYVVYLYAGRASRRRTNDDPGLKRNPSNWELFHDDNFFCGELAREVPWPQAHFLYLRLGLSRIESDEIGVYVG